MATKVVERNEVNLNGVYYPLVAPVQSALASIYPGKVVIGDTTKDSQLRTSIIAWSDWRGGIGIDRMESGGDVNRAWWSDCQLRYKDHLVLGNLANQTEEIDHGLALAGDGTGIATINEHGDKIYAVWNDTAGNNSKIYVYNNTSDYWWDGRAEDAVIGAHASDTGLEGIEIQVTDSLNYTDPSNVTWLILAHYDSSGSTWSFARYPSYDGTNNGVWDKPDTAKATKYLASWDNRLWGISHGGQLWYALTISDDDGTAVDDAVLPLPAGYCTGMFVARDAGGEPILYVSTKKGLWAHDAVNARFVKTEVEFPFHPHAGKGADRWRDSIYFPSGLGLYRYVNGTNAAVLTVVGPDRDDGLPESNRGTIMLTERTHNELLVGIDATTSPTITSADSIPFQWSAQAVTGVSGLGAQVIDANTGYSSILGYDEQGWETKWVADTAGRRIDAMYVSNAYSDVNENYRLWFGFDDNLYYMKLPVDIINPSRVTEFEYETSGTHETPWFNAGQSEVAKLALRLKVEVQDSSSSETVQVEYATNYKETYSGDTGGSLGTIQSDGITTYDFPDSTTPTGKEFRAIKFKLTLSRANSTAADKKKTPDVVSMTLEWRKKLPAKWGHQCRLDINKVYKGKSPKDLRAALVSAIESGTLVEFTFRDDSGGTRNYYVDVVSASGLEGTGYDERGMSTVNLVEP
jgi:hypothetical protein